MFEGCDLAKRCRSLPPDILQGAGIPSYKALGLRVSQGVGALGLTGLRSSGSHRDFGSHDTRIADFSDPSCDHYIFMQKIT